MTLIRSISGIRGTIGGKPGDALTPHDVVRYTAAFASLLRRRSGQARPLVVVGRDARPSGEAIAGILLGTLRCCGCDVLDLGLATTPTVELAVAWEGAAGGIILTASHNPVQWNALKLLNDRGEFISAADGAEVLRMAAEEDIDLVPVEALGTVRPAGDMTGRHIEAILALPYVDVGAIRAARLTVAVDAVNSVGGIVVPRLLKALGVERVVEVHTEPHGRFAHNPEPLPEHLVDLAEAVRSQGAHVGLAVDPDVDRLALVCEDGSPFGEEYTLVACADLVLAMRPGDTVSNLSSTRALADVAARHGGRRHASAVGEVNVVERMRQVGAPIGGEGNGGVILAESHYGRDALIGIALFLTLLAQRGMPCSALRRTYPDLFISKQRIDLEAGMDVQGLLDTLRERYADHPHTTEDGLRIEFGKDWVHLRRSNTEPIVRIYAESDGPQQADALATRMRQELASLAASMAHG